MADSGLSEKALITESAETIRTASVFTDPYERSVNYMETHSILQIFQVRKNKAAVTDIFFLRRKWETVMNCLAQNGEGQFRALIEVTKKWLSMLIMHCSGLFNKTTYCFMSITKTKRALTNYQCYFSNKRKMLVLETSRTKKIFFIVFFTHSLICAISGHHRETGFW